MVLICYWKGLLSAKGQTEPGCTCMHAHTHTHSYTYTQMHIHKNAYTQKKFKVYVKLFPPIL